MVCNFCMVLVVLSDDLCERRLSPVAHAGAIRDFEADWDRYLVLEATDSLFRRAGKLTETQSLHAYHAIHLASAKILRERVVEPASFRFIG
jgi:hypothetical protein